MNAAAAMLICLGVFVFGWFVAARKLDAKHWLIRHLAGGVAGFVAFILAFVVLSVSGLIDRAPDESTKVEAETSSAEAAIPSEKVEAPAENPILAVETKPAVEPVSVAKEQPASVQNTQSANTAPSGKLFTVLSDDYAGPIKRTVEVALEQRINEAELTTIAKQIKNQATRATERTFISYRLTGNASGPYWATTHYNPELVVRIIGMSAEEHEKAQAVPLASFASIREVVEDDGDFDEDNGTFQIISEMPLHIRFSPRTAKGDHADAVSADLKRAVIYGVYKTFIHTDADMVKVTSVPMLVTSFNPYSSSLQKSPKLEVNITRVGALKAAQKFLPVEDMKELIETQGSDGFYFTNWTSAFNELRHERINEFFTVLKGQAAK